MKIVTDCSDAFSPPLATRSDADITKAWASLGVTFDIEESSNLPVDLERTVLLSLTFMAEKRKLLRLVVDWLEEFGDLVHVERLLVLMRRETWIVDRLTAVEVRLLGGMARRLAESDRRWARIADECGTTLKRLGAKKLSLVDEDRYLVERDGPDPHFQAFGWTVPTLDRQSTKFPAKKKLHLRDEVMRRSPWLRLRAAIGSNWRADLLYIMLYGLADNPNQACRLLTCSYETAHRNWQACVRANVATLFNVGTHGPGPS